MSKFCNLTKKTEKAKVDFDQNILGTSKNVRNLLFEQVRLLSGKCTFRGMDVKKSFTPASRMNFLIPQKQTTELKH